MIVAAVVTGIVLLVVWKFAQRLRPARTYDLDPAHVALALGRRRGSRAACLLAEQQLRKGRQTSGMADGLSVGGPNPSALSPSSGSTVDGLARRRDAG